VVLSASFAFVEDIKRWHEAAFCGYELAGAGKSAGNVRAAWFCRNRLLPDRPAL
jgi:hypothetical protein